MDLSANIKQAIKAHGYNNSEVAHKLGMQQPNFSRLINSPNIRVSDLERLQKPSGVILEKWLILQLIRMPMCSASAPTAGKR